MPPIISRILLPNCIALGFPNSPIAVNVAGHLIRGNHDNAYMRESPVRLPDELWGTGAAYSTAERLSQEKYAVMQRVSWGNYTNARFQYAIRYPRDLLIPQGEPDNGDGERFLGRDGAALAVWGAYITLGQTLAQFETDTVSRLTGNSGTATFRRRRSTWLVVSGVTDDKIFHAKTLLIGNIQKSLEFTYPRETADVYRLVTTGIVSSFRSLRIGR